MEKIIVHIELNDTSTLSSYSDVTEYMVKNDFSKDNSHDDCVVYGMTYFTNDIEYDTHKALDTARNAIKNVNTIQKNYKITVSQKDANTVTLVNVYK